MVAVKSYVFSFVAKGLDSMITGIGTATKKTKDAANELGKVKNTFSEIYNIQRKEGKNVFTSLTQGIKQTTMQSGGLLKILTLVSRIGAGGILLFFASKAFQNNLGGIATAFMRLQGAFGEFWGKFNIMINEIMKAMSPIIEPLIKITTGILVDLLGILTKIVEAITKAPKPIRILIGVLGALALAFWALSANPFFVVIAAAVLIIWGIYKGIKAVVDLIKGNKNLSMNADINFGGQQYRMIGSPGTSRTNDNRVNNISNNVYLQSSGSGAGDAKMISNELSLLNSIVKVS